MTSPIFLSPLSLSRPLGHSHFLLSLTTEVTKGMAAVDRSRMTVAMVAKGDAIRITASVHPVYPIIGAASATGCVIASAPTPPTMAAAPSTGRATEEGEYCANTRV